MQYLSHNLIHSLSLDLSQTLIQTLIPGRCPKAQRWTKAGRLSLVRWRTTPPCCGSGGGGPHGQSLACLPSRQRVGAGRGSSFWLEVGVRGKCSSCTPSQHLYVSSQVLRQRRKGGRSRYHHVWQIHFTERPIKKIWLITTGFQIHSCSHQFKDQNLDNLNNFCSEWD